MDPQVSTSFIPKKPVDTGLRGSGGVFGLFFLIALLIFIASLVAAGAAFLYGQYLQNAIASKSNSLQLAEGAYDPSVIADLSRLDSRINQAGILLQSHISVSAFFNYLSTQTLQNVSFNSFSYKLNPDGSAAITLTGEADSFSTVALQSDQLGNSPMLKNVVFSDIAQGQGGGITFSVAATVVPSLLLYSNSLGQSVPAADMEVSTTSATSTPQ